MSSKIDTITDAADAAWEAYFNNAVEEWKDARCSLRNVLGELDECSEIADGGGGGAGGAQARAFVVKFWAEELHVLAEGLAGLADEIVSDASSTKGR